MRVETAFAWQCRNGPETTKRRALEQVEEIIEGSVAEFISDSGEILHGEGGAVAGRGVVGEPELDLVIGREPRSARRIHGEPIYRGQLPLRHLGLVRGDRLASHGLELLALGPVVSHGSYRRRS